MEVIKCGSKKLALSFLTAALGLLLSLQVDAQEVSCLKKDGLKGPVTSVISELTFFEKHNGKFVEVRQHYSRSTTYYVKGDEVCERPLIAYPFQGRAEFKYDDQGRAVERSYLWPSGELDVCALDAEGKCISEYRYAASGELESRLGYEYVYDSHRNWIKTMVSKHATGYRRGREESAPLYTVYRKIAYY